MMNTISNRFHLLISLILTLCSCNQKVEKSNFIFTQIEVDRKKSLLIEKQKAKPLILKVDTIGSDIFYSLKIENSLCKKVDTIFKTTIEDSNSHALDLLEKDRILRYEYTSVRPVALTTFYFNKSYEKIDSIQGALFVFEKEKFDVFEVGKNINVCEANIMEFLE